MKLRKTRKCNCRMLPLFSFVFNSKIPSLVSLLLAKNLLEHAALRGPQARVYVYVYVYVFSHHYTYGDICMNTHLHYGYCPTCGDKIRVPTLFRDNI